VKVLFDTNVVLDVLLDREPFSKEALYLLSEVERGEITGYLCARTVTTIFYLLSKALGTAEARRHTKSLLSLFIVAPVSRVVLENAINLDFRDFEDAVIHEAALHAGANYIVTRNVSDFKSTKLPVYKPDELVAIIKILRGE